MTAAIQFKKAERTRVRLKIGIQGPAGSGKTRGGLALARALVGSTGRVAVIDTENETSAYYADEFDFDSFPLTPPYLSDRYIDAIRAAVDAGYDALLIDSISHQWAGTGGILERKDATDAHGGNQWTNWGPFTKEHERFRAEILQAPIHIIATMRTKQEYRLEENSKGKQVPKKLGMAPIQREGLDYEFGLVFELQMDNRATIVKERMKIFDTSAQSVWRSLFAGETIYNLLDPKLGKALNQWLSSAKPAPEPERISEESIAALTVEQAKLIPCPGGQRIGEPLGAFDIPHLRSMHELLIEKLQHVENLSWSRAAHAMALIIAEHEQEQGLDSLFGLASAEAAELAAATTAGGTAS